MKILNLTLTVVFLVFYIPAIFASEPVPELKIEIVQSDFVFSKENIKRATIVHSRDGSYTGFRIQLKPAAAATFKNITQSNIGRRAQIVMNNKILTTSIIESTLNGDLLLTGITQEEAQQIITHLQHQDTPHTSTAFSSIND